MLGRLLRLDTATNCRGAQAAAAIGHPRRLMRRAPTLLQEIVRAD